MKYKTLLVMATLMAAVTVGTGCAGLKGGLQSARTAVNKGFDIADKLVDGADKATGAVVGTATATATTATTSQ